VTGIDETSWDAAEGPWEPGRVRYGPAHLARLLGLPEPTAEQAAVIGAPMEPLSVIAGAGSGKSETMAARLVWLVANGMVRPERVLGLTFTRKAAGELGQRVRARLAGLRRAGIGGTAAPAPASGPAAGVPAGLSGSTPSGLAGGLPAGPADAFRATAPGPLVGTAGDLWTGRQPGAGGWPAAADPAIGLGPGGRAPGGAAAGGAAPTGSLAGTAGVGVQAGAGEQDGGLLDGEPVVSTYHSYAARLVADHALREALEPSVRLITPAVAWQTAARVVAAYAGPMDAVHWGPQSVTAAVLDLAGELAEHLCSPGDVVQVGDWLEAANRALPGRMPAGVRKILDCQRTREQLLPLVSGYVAAKAAREVMDYGDQVALAARIATRHPEVGAMERARYQVVLLDEFQDTSHAQLVLLRALFGGGHPVTAVGDPCQSIYGWRGASAGNLTRFAREFPAGTRPAKVTMLATSFRNTERVLEVAAALQQGLREQAPDVPRLVPPPERAGRGAVVCALLETAADEARWVAGQVAEVLDAPPGIAPDGEPWPGHRPEVRIQPSDVAVLCRKRAQFPLLRAAIEAKGIPVEVVGLGGLLTVPEVADIVATLRVLHDPTAGGSLARLLTGPRWRIGPRDLVALGRRARSLAYEAREQPPPAREPSARPPAPESPDEAASSGPRPAEGTRTGGGVTPEDPLAQAVTDLTADPGSLVEALDDLGEARAYSARAYQRFTALAAELRALRAHVSRPLPDLVGEVERVLGLDIEVAAQPWRDPTAARADLDAFADAAAAFADDEEEPTLGAFLAYLTAAEAEEFGLESGQPSGANAVTLTTVHAAKGLQWAAVVVPGLAAGVRSQVFPAKPRVTTRWTENPRLLPFSLRGDAADLPALADLTDDARTRFVAACSARELAEERRLAYVAVTRAAFWVACSGYWWGDAASPLGPSVFLQEVHAVCAAGTGTVAHWTPPPEEDAQNPALAEPATVSWPESQAGSRYEAVREAAALVERALDAADGGPAEAVGGPEEAVGGRRRSEAGGRPGEVGGGPGEADGGPGEAVGGPGEVGGVPGEAGGGPDGDGRRSEAGEDGRLGAAGRGLSGADRVLARAWARDTDLLLAELAQRRGGAATEVWLPGRLAVSSLVAMAADPARLAQQIRRPMPRPPAPQAQRGTAFHLWLEQRFGQQRLIDPEDLLGAADDAEDDADEADLALLRERFEEGEWGDRWPVDVEVPFETLIGGRTVRGRIDAVFADPRGGGYDVVDWKTGQPPDSAAELNAAAVQLAAYRVAWARLARVPLDLVRAGFYYVRHDLTLRPADLLDEAGLAMLIEEVPLAG
jgi:DNA helicase II / ATP-dependent DNA helicase PcrA